LCWIFTKFGKDVYLGMGNNELGFGVILPELGFLHPLILPAALRAAQGAGI